MSVLRGEAARRVLAQVRFNHRHAATSRRTDARTAVAARRVANPARVQARDRMATHEATTIAQPELADHA
jgi:hypothetical protein